MTMMNDEAKSDLQITTDDDDDMKPVVPIPISSSEPNVLNQQNSTNSPPPAPFTPFKNSRENRKRLKTTLYGFPSLKTINKRSPKVELDPLPTNLSYVKKKAATKELRVPIPDSETMIRAKELQSTLGKDHPSFIKAMGRSHVTVGFSMRIPEYFCKKFLPKDDSLIVAEDENGHKCDIKFLAHNNGLSGGWKGFAAEHKLHEGDVCIFQLVEHCKFKIYIVRADISKQNDDVLQFINQGDRTEHITPGSTPMDSSPSSPPLTKVKRKFIRSKPPTSLTIVERKFDRSKPQTPVSKHLMDHSVVNSEVQQDSDSETMIRAKELQSTLVKDHPSFIKLMARSHVTIGFWMGVPGYFCKKFLPKDDSLIVAEDENGHQCDIKFLAHNNGLSGGWRGFAVDHKLHEGDVLIFQLVEPCKFKIYIVRADVSKQFDDQTELVTPGSKPTDSTPSSPPLTKVRKKYIRSKPPTPLTMLKNNFNTTKPQTTVSSHLMDHSVVNSDVQEGSGSLKPILSLEEVEMFKDFHIMVDNRCIDSELSEEIRMNYYKLCITKNEILHANIHEGLYYKLVAGMIGEIVNIANMLRNCKLSTKKEEFQIWDSSLKYFELIGMKVGFLRGRIRELTILTFESDDVKRYVEAKEERNQNEHTIKDLESKAAKLKDSNRKLDVVIASLKEKADDFQKTVDAPW